MNLLDGIRSFVNGSLQIADALVPDPGDIVQQGAHILGLPDPVGHAAAALLNVATGNYGAAVLDTAELLTDGTDTRSKDAGQSPARPSTGRSQVDPGPPPPLELSSQRQDVAPAFTPTVSTSSLVVFPRASTPPPAPAVSAGSCAPNQPSPAPAHFATAAAPATTPSPVVPTSGWRGTPPSSVGAPPAPPQPTTVPFSSTDPTPTARAITATDTSAEPSAAAKPPAPKDPPKADPPKKPTSKPDSTDDGKIKAFLDKDDLQLLRDLEDGKVPPEIAKDPLAMQAFQVRIHRIQELFTMISTMMRNLHELRMGMINNCRA